MIRCALISHLLTLLAVPARLTAPGEALDDVGTETHALTVDHELAVGTLKRVISLSDIGNALDADLAPLRISGPDCDHSLL